MLCCSAERTDEINMEFDIRIKNFGKIKDAKIKIRPFTVIAGKNSSGKSFVTKALYSFFSTINQDHVTADASQTVLNIHRLLLGLIRNLSRPSMVLTNLLNELLIAYEEIKSTVNLAYGNNTIVDQISQSYLLDESIDAFKEILERIEAEIKNKKKYKSTTQPISLITHHLKLLKRVVDDPNDVLAEKIQRGFSNSLKENFQVQSLSELKSFNSSENEHISFDFDELGEVNIDKEQILFSLKTGGIDEFQKLFNVVYLESPIYWKLKGALEKVRSSISSPFNFMHRKKDALMGVPKYFYDVLDLMDEKIKTSDDTEQNIELYKDINNAIGGEIKLSDAGDIYFDENGYSENISINTTATGVTNLGIISLLLKRNIISKGSFLIVDEPEVNLHPAWQKVMVEALYKLSKNGMNVVIASHSIDMMKCIENIMETVDDDVLEGHFGINPLSDSDISHDSPNLKKMSAIKADLGTPFLNMFLESDWT